MNSLDWLEPSALAEYAHIAFVVGVLLGYGYFRRTQISVGGTLAVGYLAASLHHPLNVVATIVISLVGYVVIRFGVLNVYLPRPRQIFGIGLAVGIACGAPWLAIANVTLDTPAVGPEIVGVVVPGMLCNSLTKQGVRKTLVPLAWMIPLSGLIGLLLARLTGTVLPLRVRDWSNEPGQSMAFAICVVGVITALLIQEWTVDGKGWRTGGYVTAGLVVLAAYDSPIYLPLLLVATLLVLAVFAPFTRKVPLFGKDRFIVLLLFSFTAVTAQEILLTQLTELRVGAPESIVYCILPAIIANDLVQYGIRRTGSGMATAIGVCATVGTPLLMLS